MKLHNDVLLTKDGLAHLQKEYDELVKVKRPWLVARLTKAREEGDLSENSDYAAAREDLAFVDGRITELEEVLHGAKLVKLSGKGKSHIDVGSTVKLTINGKKETFTIVGEWEADPSQKKISNSSPLGKALIGKKVGEQVEVEAPVGKIIYKILGIE